MIRRAWMYLLLLAFMTGVTGACAAQDMTVLVYMAGSDLESQSGAAGRDLDEMVSAMPADGRVRVLVLTGGALTWQNGIPADKNILWEVTGDGLKQLEETPADSMGDPETLKNFLCRGAELAPAARTFLIFWDHGAGPLSGVCFDERSGQDSLSLDEIGAALAGSPFAESPLECVGFDACLMASVEVANALTPYAEYMVASQETEPASGWDYEFLSRLPDTADGAEAGCLIVDSYADSFAGSFDTFTLSCVRLAAVPALVREIGGLFGTMDWNAVSSEYSKLASGRNNTKVLGSGSPVPWDLVDLQDFMGLLQENGVLDATPLQDAMAEAVVSSRTSEPYVHGLSIYAPFSNKGMYTTPWAKIYDGLDFSEGYQSFVRAFAREWMSESRVSWRNETEIRLAAQNQWMHFSTTLTEEETADLACARLLILEESVKDEYRMIYTSEVLHSRDGTISADYHNEALYLTDDNGEIIDGPLIWKPLNTAATPDVNYYADRIATIGVQTINLSEYRNVYLTWKPTENGEYDLDRIYVLHPEAELFFPVADTLKPGDFFRLGSWTRRFPETGAAYERWDFGNYVIFCEAEYTGETNWHLRFLPLQSAAERYAVFEMTDLQANVHLSEMIPIEDRSVIDVKENLPQTSAAEGIEVTLEWARIHTGADLFLELDMTVHNTLSHTTVLSCEALLLDDRMPGKFHDFQDGEVSLSYPAFSPGERRQVTLRIQADDLRMSRIEEMKTLRIFFSRDGYNDAVRNTFCLEFSLPVYLGMISLPFADEPEPVASIEENGVTVTVTRACRKLLETAPCIELDMMIRNTADTGRWISGGTLEIDGTDIRYALLLPEAARTLYIPAHSEMRYTCIATVFTEGDTDPGEIRDLRFGINVLTGE